MNGPRRTMAEMAGKPYFEKPRNWKAACALLSFKPRKPHHTEGFRLESLRVHVRDHKQRELPVEGRTLEAHYGAFALSQARRSAAEARRLALDVPYGQAVREMRIGGHAARVYELGPEPEPGDIDGRSPSVVAWHDGEMFYFLASGEMSSGDLVKIAESLYR